MSRVTLDTQRHMLKIGCHVSAAGGVFNAPKNAADLGCETFQIFTRPPMGGKAPELTPEIVQRFKREMEKYYPLTPVTPSRKGGTPLLDKEGLTAAPRSLSLKRRGTREAGEAVGGVFVVHCPYFINFGSAQPRIFHGSSSVVREELERASLIGAKYVMTHLGSAKDLGHEIAFEQTKKGLAKVLSGYTGSAAFLLEIAAGAGEVIGHSFEDLADLMEPLVKFKTFGGICFDTQHAFSSGYDLRDGEAVAETFKKFDKVIGLKWLKMSHINDSKIDLGGRKDRHDHIGDGKIGQKGFAAIMTFCQSLIVKGQLLSPFPLILETEHDKVKIDIKILKGLRDKIKK